MTQQTSLHKPFDRYQGATGRPVLYCLHPLGGVFMRYFFDLFIDGNAIPDNDGKEFETVEAVQEAAVQLALELKREFPDVDKKTAGSVMEVNREDGMRIFAFPIHDHQFCRDTVP